MLSLTKKTEYALIATCHLARVAPKVVSAREISAQHAVPLPILMNVLKMLNQTGFVRSIRGARGGYALAIAPDRISLASLIEAVEGPVRLVRCSAPSRAGRAGCDLMQSCSIRRPVQRVHGRLREFLSGVTVADMAFDDGYVELSAQKVVVP